MNDAVPERRDALPATEAQRIGFERHYDKAASERPANSHSSNPVTRFLLERRLRIAVGQLMKLTTSRPADWSVLVSCAGTGIEGTFLADRGFRDVTISDFSESGLRWGASLDPRLKCRLLDAENMDIPENSYDLVVVQDGLHHLPRPPIGLTEMIRVARRAVIVIEPHAGIVSKMLGTEWERTDSAVNYVFRWNKWLFCSVVQSYLLLGSKTAEVLARAPVDPKLPYRLKYDREEACSYRIRATRLWDHHGLMQRLAGLLGNGSVALIGVRAAYACCSSLLPRLGNMFIGIVIKDDERTRTS